MPVKDVTEDQIIHMMVGRTLDEKYPKSKAVIGEEMLRVEHLSGKGFNDISFSVRTGEIMGVFGLVGAGRTETMRGLFGADPLSAGKIFLQVKEIKIKNPGDAIREGIVLVT